MPPSEPQHRSTRRRRKKKKNAIKEPFSLKKALKAKSMKARFLQTFIGMVIGFGMIGGFWLYVNRGESTANNSQETFDPITDYEKIRDSGTIEQKIDLLTNYQTWPRTVSLPLQADYQYKRIELVKAILKEPAVDDTYRRYAIRQEMDAVGTLYGIDFMNKMGDEEITQRATELAESYLDDPDPDVARDAKLLQCKINVFEYIKNPIDENFNVVAENLRKIANEYPGDIYVFSNLAIMLKRMVMEKHPRNFDLVDEIAESYNQNDSPKLREEVGNLRDFSLIIQSDIERHFFGDWLGTEENQRQIREKMLSLAGNPTAGVTMMERIEQGLVWLERMKGYEIERAVAQRLLDSLPQRSDPKVRQLAEAVARGALQRLELIDKPFDFSPIVAQNPSVSASDFDGKVTILFFHDFRNQKANEFHKSLARMFARMFDRRPVKLVMIVDQPLPDDWPTRAQEKRMNWLYVQDSADMDPAMSVRSQIPVHVRPYLVLIGPDGRVTDLNVPLTNLQTRVQSMLPSN